MNSSTVASLTVTQAPPPGAVPLLDFRFGRAAGAGLPIPLRALGGSREAWCGTDPAMITRRGAVELRASGDLLAASMSVDVSPQNLAEATRRVYGELLTSCRASGFPHLVRIWNHLPDINGPAAGHDPPDAGYRAFCAGRAAALADFALDAAHLPAASAMGGAPGTPLVIVFLASRSAVRHLENPRQVSAYHYPEHYAGVGPAFARATLRADLLLVSGTAAIVGHESRHPGNVRAQLDCALDNVALLLELGRARAGAQGIGSIAARIYLRDPGDLAAARTALPGCLPGPLDLLFLAADPCRRELLVEVEAAVRLAT